MKSKQSFLYGLRNELINDGYYKTSINDRRYKRLQSAYKTQCNHRHLAREEFDKLAAYAQSECNEAIELTVIYSTRIIAKIVRQYKTKFTPEIEGFLDDDLMQAGFEGVYLSIDKWNPEKGAFTSYATYRIIKKVKQAIRTTSDLMAIKGSVKIYLVSILPYLMNEYETKCYQNSFAYTIDGFVNWLDLENKIPHYVNKGDPLSISEIKDLLDAISIGSFNETYHNADGDDVQVSLINNIPDGNSSDPTSEFVVNNGMREILKDFYGDVLSILPLPHQLVMIAYYNLDDNMPIKPDQEITFKKVASYLNKKFPGQKWTALNCEAYHNDALQKIKSYVAQKDLNFNDFSSVKF